MPERSSRRCCVILIVDTPVSQDGLLKSPGMQSSCNQRAGEPYYFMGVHIACVKNHRALWLRPMASTTGPC